MEMPSFQKLWGPNDIYVDEKALVVSSTHFGVVQ